MSTVRLGELLIEKKHITRDQLRVALEIQSYGDKYAKLKPGEMLGKVLVKMGFIEPLLLVRVLCEQKGNVDFLYVGKYIVEPRVVTWLPEEIALEHAIIPLVSLGEGTLVVSASRELTDEEISGISNLVARKVEAICVKDDKLAEQIKGCYETFNKRGLSSVRIGEVLIRDNYITEEDLEEALKVSQQKQQMIGRVLIEMDKLNEADFFKLLSTQRKIPFVTHEDILPDIDESLAKTLSKAFCIHNFTVPYHREGDTISVVTAEPSIDSSALLSAFGCKRVKIKLATYSDISSILREIFSEEVEEVKPEEPVEYNDVLEDVPIADALNAENVENVEYLTKRYQNITNALLLQSIKLGASDIHIEAYESQVCLRYRVDGTLYDNNDCKIDKNNVGGVVNVLKISAGMNIAERRLPQGGRFRRRTGGQVFDFRVQSQPTLYGENLVLRLLKQSAQTLTLDELGFLPEIQERYEKLIHSPSGLILITGPTGSGKTTTLYSTLGILCKDVSKKILTIEDPIEYSVDRIQQSQTKDEIGFGFPDAIRAFLREDPDIMLIGEVRDKDTAMETMRASQTGHLVFSTLHVNNTVETVQRLLDLDLVPGTIASETLAILSQRLAKRNCPHCIAFHRPSKDLLDSFYPGGVPKGVQFSKSTGCQKCKFQGHIGRLAILEFWFLDSDSKKLIIDNAGFEDIYERAINAGLIPMVKDALLKVEAGSICLDELPKVIPYYQISRWTSMRKGQS